MTFVDSSDIQSEKIRRRKSSIKSQKSELLSKDDSIEEYNLKIVSEADASDYTIYDN